MIGVSAFAAETANTEFASENETEQQHESKMETAGAEPLDSAEFIPEVSNNTVGADAFRCWLPLNGSRH